MSLPIPEFQCAACGLKGSWWPWGNWNYELPSGHTAGAWTGSGWCSACNTITTIEIFPSIERIQREIEESTAEARKYEATFFERLKTTLSSDRRYWRDRALEEQRRLQTNLAEAREFLAVRCSPPKCLKCGSERVEPIDLRAKLPDGSTGFQVSHNGCSNAIRVTDGPRFSLGSIRVTVMDTEANVIKSYDRPFGH